VGPWPQQSPDMVQQSSVQPSLAAGDSRSGPEKGEKTTNTQGNECPKNTDKSHKESLKTSRLPSINSVGTSKGRFCAVGAQHD